MNLTYGADPEFFAATEKHGVISPALLIEENKIRIEEYDEKHPVFYKDDRFSWMMDGVAFEITLLQPHENPENIYYTIKDALKTLRSILNGVTFEDYPIKIETLPAIRIRPEIYQEKLANPMIFQGFIFGCDEDFDAIEMNYEGNTIDVFNHEWRYGAGHIHVGTDSEEFLNKLADRAELDKMIQLAAIYAGNTAIAFSSNPKLDRQRTFHYGRPGRFRPQDWGFEYRTPSNLWTKSLKTTKKIFEAVAKAVESYENNMWKELTDNFLEETIKNILDADKKGARKLLAQLP